MSDDKKKYTDMSSSEKKKEDWMNSKWRPMMGWMYMAVCMADFVLFPVLWSLVQAAHGGQVHTQWQPITLQGAGLFHMAMGAIIGVTAFGRTQEKLNGANNGGINSPGTFGPQPTGGYRPTPVNNSYGNTPLGGNRMSAGDFGSHRTNYNTYDNQQPSNITYSSSGKAKPPEQIDPLI
jgi:hypothetical protein